ncbi:hypothetical protein [Roseimaritima sediminicola]|uniref:hypothetical protein n=1 Tax=Roseimaritima sediminicola TaxID=2662066 RepID=UPI00129844F4|nr:hypothetical protein [Roseimaritima sediminicola]
MDNTEPTKRFLTLLENRLLYCQQCYESYLGNGETYHHAKLLLDANLELRNLIMDYGHTLPTQYREDAKKLLEHIRAWLDCWQRLDHQREFRESDQFVFDNDSTFPRKAADSLMQLLSKFRKHT